MEGIKTLMGDYKAPGVAAPRTTWKDDNDQGLVFAKTQEPEWANRKKTLTCFGCGKKGHVLKKCDSTSKKERTKIWETKKKGFGRNDAPPRPPQERMSRRRRG